LFGFCFCLRSRPIFLLPVSIRLHPSRFRAELGPPPPPPPLFLVKKPPSLLARSWLKPLYFKELPCSSQLSKRLACPPASRIPRWNSYPFEGGVDSPVFFPFCVTVAIRSFSRPKRCTTFTRPTPFPLTPQSFDLFERFRAFPGPFFCVSCLLGSDRFCA